MGENLEITSKGYLSLFDHEHMSRGVTLHEKEMRQMFDLMKKRRMENRFKREEPSAAPLPQQAMPAGVNDGFVQSPAPEESFNCHNMLDDLG